MSARPNPFVTIAIAGLVVGVLDGLDAVVFTGLRGVSAERLFQFIASAVLGRAAFSQGMPSVALGVALHFAVAFCLAAAFWIVAQVWPRLKSPWFWSGAAFGLLSYALMNYAILPLTRVTRAASQSWPALTNGILAHIFLVGVPIAFVVWRREGAEPRSGS
jgi:hypothetical protein